MTTLAASAAAEPVAAPAPPPTKEACVASFDRGQRAQSDRALRRALSELIVCSQESCPTVLRADCAGVLAEVRSALPSVVFAADDGSGHELTDVKVYASDELLTSKLDGRAVPIDPGTFELRFERVGQPAVVVSQMIREGEKSRVIRVSLGATPGGVGADVARGSDAPSGHRTAVGWAVPGSFAAVGLAGLGVALFTRLSFDSRVEELRASCGLSQGLLLAALVSVGCSDPLDNEQRLASNAQPLRGPSVVPDYPTDGSFVDRGRRATVEITTTGADVNCNGVLLTPLVILTAAHCLSVVGQNSFARFTARERDLSGDHQTVVELPLDPSRRLSYFAGTGTIPAESDIGLLFVRESSGAHALSFDSLPFELIRTRIQRPSFTVHPGQVFMVTNLNTGFDNRVIAAWDTFIDVNGKVSGFHRNDETDVRGASGDSGSPFFSIAPDGGRDVFGVATEHDNFWIGEGNLIGADITRPAVRTWIESNVVDNARSAEWKARHAMANPWYGELDYTGDCRSSVDEDCDGWFNSHDDCPSKYDPFQRDIDGDGFGDACDSCKSTHNPNQANCNAEYEVASRARGLGVETLGDACDPVPCPSAAAPAGPQVGSTLPASCLGGPYFGREVRDAIMVSPIGPHVRNPPSPIVGSVPPAVPLDNVPTKARFCNEVPGLVNCRAANVLRDSQLKEDVPAEAVRTPDPDAPWQRITLRETRFGSARPPNDNSGFSYRYADGESRTLFWDYLADNAFWHRDGLDVVQSNAPGKECSKTTLFGNGTCLNGRLWTHADTDIGRNTSSVGGIEVGTHGAELANHVFDLVPDGTVFNAGCEAPVFDPCSSNPGACVSNFIYRLRQCPMCSFVARSVADDRIQLPFIKINAHAYGLIWKSAALRAEDIGLVAVGETDVMIAELLSTYNFVTAVESSPPLDGEVDAVAFPASSMFGGSTQYLFANSLDQSGLGARASASSQLKTSTVKKSAGSAPLASGLSDDPRRVLDRLDAKVVYSRVMHGAFVVGGTDADSGAIVTSVLFEPVDGALTSLAGSIPAEVLAATLTRASSEVDYLTGQALPSFLWTVERDEAGIVALAVREITRDSVSAPLHLVALPSDSADGYALSGGWAADDSALLSVSNSSERRWATFEVGGFLQGECMNLGTGCLELRPLVDGMALANDSYLFRGVYAEADALVLPVVEWNDEYGDVRSAAERKPRSALVVSAAIVPTELREWLR